MSSLALLAQVPSSRCRISTLGRCHSKVQERVAWQIVFHRKNLATSAYWLQPRLTGECWGEPLFVRRINASKREMFLLFFFCTMYLGLIFYCPAENLNWSVINYSPVQFPLQMDFFPSNEHRLVSFPQIQNKGQPNVLPPIGRHWLCAVVLVFVAFYAACYRYRQRIVEKDEMRSKMGGEYVVHAGLCPPKMVGSGNGGEGYACGKA